MAKEKKDLVSMAESSIEKIVACANKHDIPDKIISFSEKGQKFLKDQMKQLSSKKKKEVKKSKK